MARPTSVARTGLEFKLDPTTTNGALYGTTAVGGTANAGTIFKLVP
jgi:uncharacterized repeat protein (TIGR03803 family)